MKYEYTFKTYIANGREHYEYSIDALTSEQRRQLERYEHPVVIKLHAI